MELIISGGLLLIGLATVLAFIAYGGWPRGEQINSDSKVGCIGEAEVID